MSEDFAIEWLRQQEREARANPGTGQLTYYGWAADTIATLRRELDILTVHLSNAEHARGDAEGRLAASHFAGVVDGWRERALAAEAEVERLTRERDEAIAMRDSYLKYTQPAVLRRAEAAEALANLYKEELEDTQTDRDAWQKSCYAAVKSADHYKALAEPSQAGKPTPPGQELPGPRGFW